MTIDLPEFISITDYLFCVIFLTKNDKILGVKLLKRENLLVSLHLYDGKLDILGFWTVTKQDILKFKTKALG